jgi:hypothetical protein
MPMKRHMPVTSGELWPHGGQSGGHGPEAGFWETKVGLLLSLWTFFNPQPNPQQALSCTTSAKFGSPRSVVSCCKT